MSSDALDDATRSFLSSLLDVVLRKMRWDKDEDPADLDEDDVVAFDGLRKVGGLCCLSAVTNVVKRT